MLFLARPAKLSKDVLSKYNAVGILEHWDISMRLFDARVQSPVARWTDLDFKVNAASETYRRHLLHTWAYNSSEIHSVLEGDLLLYEHAVSLFQQQTEQSLGMVWS